MQYLKDIQKYPLLTPEEEKNLSKRSRNGDKEAFNRLVLCNLRFVVSIAKQFQNRNLSFNDLINEGNMGLIEAAKRFDESLGFHFVTYATWWIRQSILKAIYDKSNTIRIPRNKYNKSKNVVKSFGTIVPQLDKEIAVEKIHEENRSGNNHFQDYSKSHIISNISLDYHSQCGEELKLADCLRDSTYNPPDQNLLDESLEKMITNIFTCLTPIEATILMLYFGFNQSYPRTYQEIASLLSQSHAWTRQIKARALFKLKNILKKQDCSDISEYM